jgi:hypothetical protein
MNFEKESVTNICVSFMFPTHPVWSTIDHGTWPSRERITSVELIYSLNHSFNREKNLLHFSDNKNYKWFLFILFKKFFFVAECIPLCIFTTFLNSFVHLLIPLLSYLLHIVLQETWQCILHYNKYYTIIIL